MNTRSNSRRQEHAWTSAERERATRNAQRQNRGQPGPPRSDKSSFFFFSIASAKPTILFTPRRLPAFRGSMAGRDRPTSSEGRDECGSRGRPREESERPGPHGSVVRSPVPCDVAIQTVVSHELHAVLDALGFGPEHRQTRHGDLFWVGQVASECDGSMLEVVVHCQGRAGNANAGSAAAKLIQIYEPRLMVLLGIAAGMRHALKIGDVVVASSIVDVTIQVAEAGEMRRRPDIVPSPHVVTQMIRAWRSEPSVFLQRFQSLLPEPLAPHETTSIQEFEDNVAREPSVRELPIVSSDTLLRDPELLVLLREQLHQQICIVEMEAAGFIKACAGRHPQIPWLVLRGISDFGDALKHDGFHGLASRAAAAYLGYFLRCGFHSGLLATVNSGRVDPSFHSMPEKPPFIGVPSESLGAGFKGREDALRELHEALVGQGRVVLTNPAQGRGRVYAHGGGGIGKSRLAIEYAWRHESDFPGGVFYASVKAREPLALCAEFGREMFSGEESGVDETFALNFARWLEASGRGRTLIVLDDVQGEPEEVAMRFTRSVRVRGCTIWPFERHVPVCVLFTTRLNELPVATPFELSQLSNQAAFELLIERSERGALSTEDENAARDLAGTVLGGHPLALALAGAYLKRVGPPFSFAEYRRKLGQKGLTVALEEAGKHARRAITDHDRSIVGTYELSRKELKLGDPEDALAWRILKITAYLNPKVPIDRRLVWRILEKEGSDASMEEVGLATTRLIDLSLLDPSREKGRDAGDLMIHPVVADYTTWVARAEEPSLVRSAIIRTLLGLFHDKEEDSWNDSQPSASGAIERLSPEREAHATYVWAQATDLLTAPKAGLALALGAHLVTRGDRASAIPLFEEARVLHEHFARQDPSSLIWQRGLAVSRERIGDMLLAQGDPTGAVTEFRAALDIVERMAERAPSDPGWKLCMVICHRNIGDCLNRQDDSTGALAEFRSAFGMAESFARQYPDVTEWQRELYIAHLKLGEGYDARDDYQAGLRAFLAALTLVEQFQLANPRDTSALRDTGIIHRNIGRMHSVLGAPTSALAAFHAALAIGEKLVGRDPGNATWQTDLAAACSGIGGVLQRGSHLERSVARGLFERARGVLHDLGSASRLTRPQQEVWLPSIERALWSEERLMNLIQQDPDNLELQMEYAQFLMLGGRPEDALGAVDEILERLPRSPEPSMEVAAMADQMKGSLLLSLGRPEEALGVFNQLLRRLDSSNDPRMRDLMIAATFNRGDVFFALGQTEDTIADFDSVVRELDGATEPNLRGLLAAALLNRAVQLQLVDRFVEAIDTYDDMLHRFDERAEPTLAVAIAQALYNKGNQLRKLDRGEEVLSTYDELLRRFLDTPDQLVQAVVARTLVNKANQLRDFGRSEEGLALYEEVVCRHADPPAPSLFEPVARAFLNKGRILSMRQQHAEALADFEIVINRFDPVEDPVVREQVAIAMFERGKCQSSLGRHDDALASYSRLLDRHGSSDRSDRAGVRSVVGDALNAKATLLHRLGRTDEAVSVIDDLLRIADGSISADVLLAAMLNRAIALAEQRRYAEALAAYEGVEQQFGASTAAEHQLGLARALFNQGVQLENLSRKEEAVAAYTRVVARFGIAGDPLLQEQVARALIAKGVVLGTLGHARDALETFDDLVRRFHDAIEPRLRARVARARFNSGTALVALNRKRDAIRTYEDLVRQFSSAIEPEVRALVIDALFAKGQLCFEAARFVDALAAYDGAAARLRSHAEPSAPAELAQALLARIASLSGLGRQQEAIETGRDLFRELRDTTDPHVGSMVVNASLVVGELLRGDGRLEEARVVLSECMDRFGVWMDSAIHSLVNRIMYSLATVLVLLGREEEEIVIYDALLPRLERDLEPTRSRTAAILIAKRDTLHKLGRFADEITACDDYLRRFADARDPETMEQWTGIALARVNALQALDRLDEALTATDTLIARISSLPLSRSESRRLSATVAGIGSYVLICLFKRASKRGDTEGARAYLDAAATRSDEAHRHLPDDPVVLGNAGYIAFLGGREQEARALIEKALALGGEKIRQGEIEDSRIHELPTDDAFRALLSSLPVGKEEDPEGSSRSRAQGSKRRRKKP